MPEALKAEISPGKKLGNGIKYTFVFDGFGFSIPVEYRLEADFLETVIPVEEIRVDAVLVKKSSIVKDGGYQRLYYRFFTGKPLPTTLRPFPCSLTWMPRGPTSMVICSSLTAPGR